MNSISLSLPLTVFLFSLFLSLSFVHNQSHEVHTDNQYQTSALHGSYKGYFSKVYAFGDSHTDTGNAHLMSGLTASFSGSMNSPYGSTTFGKHSNRLSDGRLILDFLCDSLFLPSLPPYKSTSANFSYGVNFAIAGSTSLSSDLLTKVAHRFLWKGTPMNIQTQIDWFNMFQQEVICNGKNTSSCKGVLEDALFWIGDVGINDYARSLGSSISLRSLAETSARHVSRLVSTLLESGAKYIVVQGLPPVGCLPLDMSLCPLRRLDRMGCSALVNSAISIHNQILHRRLTDFRKQYPHSTILYADYWNAYLTILMNPQKYQFEETFNVCCGARGKFNFNMQSLCGSPGSSSCKDPSKYINWDGIHLTEAMNFHVTDLLLNQGFCQPSFDQLIKKKSGM